ncbi:MAG TPA: FAD-binding oxidoreductase [Pseudonocardia sp.]|jgi:FAD/FMN-containing dehydrogenase
MTSTLGGDIDTLRAALTGRLVTPDAPDYDEVRGVFNGDIDRRPALIARCESPADVATAVTFARAHRMEVAVRGGAHSTAGSSTVDDGLVVDLSPMNQVVVDPVARRVRVGGGALLSELDAATQEHGLAVPSGMISHTGVGGLTLGGGMGWLTPQAGLSIDNLLSARMVTADGTVLRAAPDEHPQLFWALRGGGGNFGVVTEFEFRLHEVGPLVQLGLLFWGLDQGTEVLRLARDLITRLPREFTVLIAGMNAPPEPFVPEELHFQPGYAVVIVGYGGAESHAALLDQVAGTLPPLVRFAGPIPYVALQQMMDEANAWGRHCYEKGTYLERLTDGAIEVITRQVPLRSSPLSVILFYQLDGAYCEVAEEETAFSGDRTPRLGTFIVAVCPDAEPLPADREWVRDTWRALQPHSTSIGAYVNSMTEHEDDRVRAAYGTKYDRLAQIKTVYDPDNVFRRNLNITPG